MNGKVEIVNINGVDKEIELDMVLFELQDTACNYREYIEEIIKPIRKKFLDAGMSLGVNYHEKSFERDLDRCIEIYHIYYRQLHDTITSKTAIAASEGQGLIYKSLVVNAEIKKLEYTRQYLAYDKTIRFDVDQIKSKLREYRKYLMMINKIKYGTWTYADMIEFLSNYHNEELYHLTKKDSATCD